jgi:hypothetical protein
MGRYLLFAGDEYYPSGGWQDYKGRFDSVKEALKAAASGTKNLDFQGTWDWWQIVDLATGKMVMEYDFHIGLEVMPRNPDQDD